MSQLHSDAKKKYWQSIPPEKRVNHARMMVRVRWLRTTPEFRKEYTTKLNTFKKHAKGKKL